MAGTLGGPATYAVELVRALAHECPSDRVTVLTDRPALFNAVADTVRVGLRSAWSQPLWDHLGVGRALRAGDFDLYHGTKGILPRLCPVPGVVTIHDLAFYLMPQSFSLAQRLHLRVETPSTLRRAKAVITDSESSAVDLARLFPDRRDSVEVIPLAAPSVARPASQAEVVAWRKRYGVSSAAVGYLGTLQPRKNIDLLADAFGRARGDRDWVLLLVGRMRPGYRPRCLRKGDGRIRYLGPLPEEELPSFLGALSCMVSPSSYEGFGLSLVCAMAAGCPVVGLANSSVVEVVGEAGLLVETAEVAPLADAIGSIMTGEGLGEELRRRGLARAGAFSWGETARRTRVVYQRVLAGEKLR